MLNLIGFVNKAGYRNELTAGNHIWAVVCLIFPLMSCFYSIEQGLSTNSMYTSVQDISVLEILDFIVQLVQSKEFSFYEMKNHL